MLLPLAVNQKLIYAFYQLLRQCCNVLRQQLLNRLALSGRIYFQFGVLVSRKLEVDPLHFSVIGQAGEGSGFVPGARAAGGEGAYSFTH
jgi:hypothetical protein